MKRLSDSSSAKRQMSVASTESYPVESPAIIPGTPFLVRGVIKTFSNWPSILLKRVIARLGIATALTFHSRRGTIISTLPEDNSWNAVLETYVTDVYRLSDLSTDKISLVVDIGANIGDFSLACIEHFPLVRIVSYEPGPASYAQMRDNLSRNCRENAVDTHMLAVVGSSNQQTARLWMASGHSVNNSLVENINAGTTCGRWVDVATISLTEVMSAINQRIDLLKIDVEGGEYDMLSMTPSSVLERIDRLVVEYHNVSGHGYREIVEKCEEAGLRWTRHEHTGATGIGTLWFNRRNVSEGGI